MTHVQLPPNLKDFVRREFASDPVQWAHRPPAGRDARSAMWIWLFAIPWTAFTGFWEYAAITGYLGLHPGKTIKGTGGLVMVLWGIPFVLVGLAMMSAPWWVWRAARRSVWVMSRKRLAYVTANRKTTTIRTIMPNDVLEIVRTEDGDGTGTLKLVYQSTRDSDGDRRERSDTIKGIADVRRIENMIRELERG
ncbi:MAG TPA: hypothetical protein PK970_11730 [Hyphomicrobiaceae bacterium]|nr:hypothetical protein [Hyphomicrobiaceae bacterium]